MGVDVAAGATSVPHPCLPLLFLSLPSPPGLPGPTPLLLLLPLSPLPLQSHLAPGWRHGTGLLGLATQPSSGAIIPRPGPVSQRPGHPGLGPVLESASLGAHTGVSCQILRVSFGDFEASGPWQRSAIDSTASGGPARTHERPALARMRTPDLKLENSSEDFVEVSLSMILVCTETDLVLEDDQKCMD